ncbi:MAG: GPW/gp25 family protein [Saprospiraceae bacterium]|nr:GPW/gp25 family protein [Saprospiraceae bacterium]
MNSKKQKSFLGSGWSFPPQFLDSTQGIKMSHDDDDIREGLFILLSTLPGERLMNPEFGCDLHSQVFQSINNTTINTIKDLISTAILYFEPRITIMSIDVDSSQKMSGRLDIYLSYEVNGINSRRNMVYPFYLVEGTDI